MRRISIDRTVDSFNYVGGIGTFEDADVLRQIPLQTERNVRQTYQRKCRLRPQVRYDDRRYRQKIFAKPNSHWKHEPHEMNESGSQWPTA
jgi:hypothetical protein